MKNKKVLFVATVVKKHINVFHLPYLQWFQEQDYETHVCARDDFNGEKCIIPYCDKHFDIPLERSPINKNNLKAYRQFKKIIAENNYDIIHCHTPVAAMLTRFAARKARKRGTKVIYTAHGFHFFKGAPLLNWLIYFPVEWICSFFTDILITINQEDYNLAKKYMKYPTVKYIKGVGIDIENKSYLDVDKKMKKRNLDIPEESIVLLSVGELNKNKNHRVVIEALGKINNPNIYYLLCGEGPLEAELMNLSENLNLSKNIKFLGFRKDIVQLQSISDIFVFPSYREGLSLSLMEAMLAGNVCVVSNIRGNSDLISDSRFLLNPSDSSAFANTLMNLINDNNLMNQCGRENRKKIQEYDLKIILKQMEKIYFNEDNKDG